MKNKKTTLKKIMNAIEYALTSEIIEFLGRMIIGYSICTFIGTHIPEEYGELFQKQLTAIGIIVILWIIKPMIKLIFEAKREMENQDEE